MPSSESALVSARRLTKRFESFTAVGGIDFDVQPGEAFGFLGPNGAGKTSTMRMIGCASPVTSGELRIFGMDLDLIRIGGQVSYVDRRSITPSKESSQGDRRRSGQA